MNASLSLLPSFALSTRQPGPRGLWVFLALWAAALLPVSPVHAKGKEFDQAEARAAAWLKKGDYQAIEEEAIKLRAAGYQITDPFPAITGFHNGLQVKSSQDPTEKILKFKEQLDAWEAKHPDSQLLRIAQMDFWISYGWNARGIARAPHVTEEGWRLMAERLAKAIEIGETLEVEKVEDPQFYVSYYLALVARPTPVLREKADARKKALAIYQKGIQLAPEYLPLYNVHLQFMLPKWFGREGDAEAIAKEAGDQFGGEKGDAVYAHLMWIKIDDAEPTYFIKDPPADYERIKRGMLAARKIQDDPTFYRVIDQRLAYIASIRGDMETARRHLLTTYEGSRRSEDQFKQEGFHERMFELSGAKAVLDEVEALERAGKLEEAEARLVAIDPENRWTPLLQDFYLRNGMAAKYTEASLDEFHVDRDPIKSSIMDAYYIGLLNLPLQRWEASKAGASRFDETRPWNLAGRMSLLFHALKEKDDARFEELLKKTVDFKSNRPGYQLVQGVIKGEKTFDDAYRFMEGNDAYHAQTGLFLIAYYLYKKEPESARKLIDLYVEHPRVAPCHASVAKSLLLGTLQPLMAQAEGKTTADAK